MSPAAKTTRKKGDPREVKGEGSKSVRITVDGKRINVAWLCGGGRTFDVDVLRDAIGYVDGPGHKYDEVWLNLSDSAVRPYWVRIKDNKLTANDNMGDNGWVSWATLKRALQATITEVLA